jgi:hypothetical protein
MAAEATVPPRQSKRTRVGELRPSALIHTFGVGAVVDLPRMSAVVMGLDDWRLDDAPVIGESRLLAKIREHEGLEHVERLHGPPQTEDRGGLASRALDARNLIGVPVASFSRWLLCPASSICEPTRCVATGTGTCT